MKFDWQQQVAAACTVLSIGYFVAHTIQKQADAKAREAKAHIVVQDVVPAVVPAIPPAPANPTTTGLRKHALELAAELLVCISAHSKQAFTYEEEESRSKADREFGSVCIEQLGVRIRSLRHELNNRKLLAQEAAMDFDLPFQHPSLNLLRDLAGTIERLAVKLPE